MAPVIDERMLVIWLGRLGLLLDFLAFWFTAPEILGEERLRRAEDFIVCILTAIADTLESFGWFAGIVVGVLLIPTMSAEFRLIIPSVWAVLLVLLWILWASWTGALFIFVLLRTARKQSHQNSEFPNTSILRAVLTGFGTVMREAWEEFRLTYLRRVKRAGLAMIVVSLLSIAGLVIWVFLNDLNVILVIASIIGPPLGLYLLGKFADWASGAIRKIIAPLTDSSKTRKRALILGVGLFTLGALLQLVSTFVPQP